MATLDAFANQVRVEVPLCPEPMITDAILRTCIDFCKRTELLSDIISLNTEVDVAQYTVDPGTGLYPARLRAVLKDGTPLEKTDAAAHAVSSRRTESATPEAYHAPTRATLKLEPIPNAVETLELDVVYCPARTATTVPDVLFDEWLMTIVNGAKADLLAKKNHPWTNPDLALYYKDMYEDDVVTAAAEVASGNVGSAMHIAPAPI